MNTQQTPENGRGTPVVKNVTEIGNGQLIGILGVLVAIAVFGFSSVNRRIDDLTTLMNARFDDVNRRIDDNTAEIRLIRGDVNGLAERMTKVETIISIRLPADVDEQNNPIAASTPRDQR